MEFVAGGTNAVTGVGKNEWADLDVLCLTAMHKDPQRRYRTVEAFVRDLDHFLRNEPLEARGDSARYRIRKFASRHSRSLAAAGATIAAIVLLTAFYTYRMASARNTAIAEASRAERLQKFTLDLLQGGDESVGPSDSVRVVTLVDRGVQEAADEVCAGSLCRFCKRFGTPDTAAHDDEPHYHAPVDTAASGGIYSNERCDAVPEAETFPRLF